MTFGNGAGIARRTLFVGAALAGMMTALPAWAQATGELVILQWLGGTEAEMWQKLEADFVAKNPGRHRP